MNEHILIVDDEKEIADLVEIYLKGEGYTVHKFYDPHSALECIRSQTLDLAILDVMLPDIDGFEICRVIRQKQTYPVIMLTARSEDMDKINGLAIGADDYITKPFNPLEVVARVKAQLRRSTRYNNAAEPSMLYDSRGLIVNCEAHECTLFGKQIQLTPIEFKILWLLCENAGKVVSSEEIFKAIWGDDYYSGNNTVMVHVRRIREKLNEPPRNPKFIKTVWGVGYKIDE